MKEPAKMTRTATLVEGALMVALAFALSLIPPFKLPLGGSVTFFSTLPIIVMSLRHNAKWGVGVAAVYSLLQMMQGMDSVLFLKTVPTMVLCALLDYILAYTCVGLTGPIARAVGHRSLGLVVGIVATGAMRYACSVVSGVILWGQYAEPGRTVLQHSFIYNALWCWPDVAIALVAALVLARVQALHLMPQRAAARAV